MLTANDKARRVIDGFSRRDPTRNSLWHSLEFLTIASEIYKEGMRKGRAPQKRIASIVNAMLPQVTGGIAEELAHRDLLSMVSGSRLSLIADRLRKVDDLTKDIVPKLRKLSAHPLPQVFYDLRRTIPALRINLDKLRKIDQKTRKPQWSFIPRQRTTLSVLGLSPDHLGKKGPATSSPDAARRPFVIRAVVTELPLSMQKEYSFVARLLTAGGIPATKDQVKRALEPRRGR